MKNIQITIQKKIGLDRMLHFAFGGWVACLGSTWYYAFLISFFIGLLKELVYDKWIRKSKFDTTDWVATFLGGAVTALVILIKAYLL